MKLPSSEAREEPIAQYAKASWYFPSENINSAIDKETKLLGNKLSAFCKA